MTEQKFKSEMRRVEIMRGTGPDRFGYWSVYTWGLRRGYHGKNFGTGEEHKKWLGLINSRDSSRQERGWGYRDGLKNVEISSQMGRPRVGNEILPAITIPGELKAGLKSRAGELGLSLPDARREAYRFFVDK